MSTQVIQNGGGVIVKAVSQVVRYRVKQSKAIYRVIAGPGGGGGEIPSQTGNSGKFLTTDGATLSWSNSPAADDDARFLALIGL